MTKQKQRILRIVCVASVFLVAFGATFASLMLISKNTEDVENAPVADENQKSLKRIQLRNISFQLLWSAMH